MITLRRLAREAALKLLYAFDGKLSSSEELRSLDSIEITRLLKELSTPEKSMPFAYSLVSGVIDHKDRLDKTIQSTSARWRLERMSIVDRNILRLAAYELIRYQEESVRDTPPSVIIDEAVELAKRFGAESSPPFVNGILDGIRLGHEAAQTPPPDLSRQAIGDTSIHTAPSV